MERVKITLEIDKEALNLIDEAAKKDFSSRTNLMIRSSVKTAREILKDEN
jgi:uncharacterized protein (DUF1778 family)